VWEPWPYLLVGAQVLISGVASGHALLNKRESTIWVALIWLVPFVGAILYATLGINRIQRRAHSLRGEQARPDAPAAGCVCSPAHFEAVLGSEHAYLQGLTHLVQEVTQRPLLHGNRVHFLRNGDEAYPAMLEAINDAKHSVGLSSYIFSNDHAGGPFVEALGTAMSRGVEVRVLVDGVGRRYSWPPITRALARSGIPFSAFLPTLMPWHLPYANLRNHRKILVVDGETGFTGGLNIRENNLLEREPANPTRDLHFRVTGPCVAHMQEAFVTDWAFSTGELLEGERWFPELTSDGSVLARGISDGPDGDLHKLRWVILGAIGSARSRVTIVTPYFLPDASLIAALKVAAMRGVEVTIVLPGKSNLALVQWASTALLWQLLEAGCRIWLSAAPFDHTKLMLVDDAWILLGSANWDARSLRLNFEFNLECYDRGVVAHADEVVTSTLKVSRRITKRDVDGRRLPVKLRDAAARTLSPFL